MALNGVDGPNSFGLVSSPKEEPVEVTPEQRKIAEAAVVFADYVTTKWPQSEDGTTIQIEGDEGGPKIDLPDLPLGMREKHLNYYFVGSLAMMLLSKAESAASMDESVSPKIREKLSAPMSERAKEIYTSLARPIGDLDFIATGHSKNPAVDVAGLSYSEIPEQAQVAVKLQSGQKKMEMDQAMIYGEDSFVRITAEGKDYYVASPVSMVGYKALHAIEKFDVNPAKITADFKKLFDAAREMYSMDALVDSARKIFQNYEGRVSRVRAEGSGRIEEIIRPKAEAIISSEDSPLELKQLLQELLKEPLNVDDWNILGV